MVSVYYNRSPSLPIFLLSDLRSRHVNCTAHRVQSGAQRAHSPYSGIFYICSNFTNAQCLVSSFFRGHVVIDVPKLRHRIPYLPCRRPHSEFSSDPALCCHTSALQETQLLQPNDSFDQVLTVTANIPIIDAIFVKPRIKQHQHAATFSMRISSVAQLASASDCYPFRLMAHQEVESSSLSGGDDFIFAITGAVL